MVRELKIPKKIKNIEKIKNPA
jgi:hypothetical protein